jgi:hypothetical protein
MEKRKFLCIILVVVQIFICGICLFALDTDVILSELKRLNIEVTGSAKQIEIQLPTELTGPNWGFKKIICEEAGYDLSAYAGRKVLFTYFPINEKWNLKEPLNVWVISNGEKIICVYKTVREDSNLAPGIFPVENPIKKD